MRIDDQAVRDFLNGIDERHAKSTDFTSKMMVARAELYRALENSVAILIEQIGNYKVASNGQFVFSSTTTADRYNGTAREINAAAKRVAELQDEGKQLMQSQQEGWERLVTGK
jgi:hypothetical protein